MSVVTKLAHVETTTAIWEFNPTLSQNWVLDNTINVVAVIRTLAIKIQASGQHIAYFERLQKECGIDVTLKIPLHSNVHWGTADGMLARSYDLWTVCPIFLVLWLSLTQCQAHQFIYQLGRWTLWPDYLNPSPWAFYQEHPVGCFYTQASRLGSRPWHPQNHCWCQFYPTSFLTWKPTHSLACYSSLRGPTDSMGRETGFIKIHIIPHSSHPCARQNQEILQQVRWKRCLCSIPW